MLDRQANGFNFKKIPKVLNISGASTSTLSVDSTPYSDRTAATSVNNTPLSKNIGGYLPHGSRSTLGLEYPNTTTPLQIQRNKRQNILDVYNCSYCNLPLQNIFEGERLVDLNCGHSLHFKCFNEWLSPAIFANDSNNKDESSDNNEIICPSCNVSTFCDDDTIMTNTKNSQLLQKYDDLLNPGDEMSNLLSTIYNFQLPTMTSINDETLDFLNANNIIKDTNDAENNDEDPVTPNGQMGMNFWEREGELLVPNITAMTQEKKKNVSLFNSEIELAKVLFAPEYSSLSIENDIEIGTNNDEISNFGCVINISTTEFEQSLEFNKKEQLKAQVGKNKITNTIINNFNKNLNNSTIDFSNVGNLILFDIFDTTIKLNSFKSCQIYLFESNIIILNENGTQLLLNQELNSQIFISSIYQDSDGIIINLNSIKIPSITFLSSNKILRHKWYVILKKISKNVDVNGLIPLIQTSTNAWSLIENDNVDDGAYNDVIPEYIRIVNKLTSKGLDLPSKFLKRQILRPDSIPKVIILALPLVNCEDYGVENNEYASVIKKMITETLNLLNPRDQLGVVFLGDHIKNLSQIGNYYGCVTKNWPGWSIILDSITGDVIAEEDNSHSNRQLDNGLRYIELLANLRFNNVTKDKNEYLHQVIYVSNEILSDYNVSSTTDSFKIEQRENPFLTKRQKRVETDISKKITLICEKFDATFTYLLLADEFRFEPYEIILMNRLLKQHVSIDENELNNNNYNNKIKLQIALDIENLIEVLKLKIEELNEVTIKKLETNIKFPEFIKLKSFESSLGKINHFKQTNDENEYIIKLKNLSSGYEKSLLLNLYVDFKNNSFHDNKIKSTFAKSNTKIVADKLETEFKRQMDIRLIKHGSTIENNMTLKLNVQSPPNSGHNDSIEIKVDTDVNTADATTTSVRRQSDLNLSIVSKLSSMSDAFFIRRKIQLLIIEKLNNSVLEIKNFDSIAKENAKETFKKLINEIWELSTSCNSSNTNNIKENSLEKWTDSLTGKLEDIVDGYSLRNYQLSNMKCVLLFLELE